MANDKDHRPRVNPGYVLDQLLRALSGTGERAAERAEQWKQVIAGLLDGSLRVGSRTPVAEVPPWVTLEVAHGGFATGNLAAGGPVQPHEVEALASIPRPGSATERAALNLPLRSGATSTSGRPAMRPEGSGRASTRGPRGAVRHRRGRAP